MYILYRKVSPCGTSLGGIQSLAEYGISSQQSNVQSYLASNDETKPKPSFWQRINPNSDYNRNKRVASCAKFDGGEGNVDEGEPLTNKGAKFGFRIGNTVIFDLNTGLPGGEKWDMNFPGRSGKITNGFDMLYSVPDTSPADYDRGVFTWDERRHFYFGGYRRYVECGRWCIGAEHH